MHYEKTKSEAAWRSLEELGGWRMEDGGRKQNYEHGEEDKL